MKKKLTIVLEVLENNTSQNWTFENITSMEQLALWVIVKEMAQKNIWQMLNRKEQVE
jgi:hypothetical protein